MSERGNDTAADPIVDPAARGGIAEELLVLSTNPRRVLYREGQPPFDVLDAVLVAERPDGRAILFYLRGQNGVTDYAAQPGKYEFGGYWEFESERAAR